MNNANDNNWVKFNQDGTFDVSDWTKGLETANIELFDDRSKMYESTSDRFSARITYADGRKFFAGAIEIPPSISPEAQRQMRVENAFRKVVYAHAYREDHRRYWSVGR